MEVNRRLRGAAKLFQLTRNCGVNLRTLLGQLERFFVLLDRLGAASQSAERFAQSDQRGEVRRVCRNRPPQRIQSQLRGARVDVAHTKLVQK